MGDLGRSPRMLNHARALSANGAEVTLVGYVETSLPADVGSDPRIHLAPIPAPPRADPGAARSVFLFVSALRVVWQTAQLMRTLLAGSRPDLLLVQNPPSIPTLAVARLAAWLRGSQLIVDWHNFGFSMLAVRLGQRHRAVKIARWYEQILARGSAQHLCVSNAMKDWLAVEFSVSDATVVYDRPLARLRPLTGVGRQTTLAEIGAPLARGGALAVCPTSWTIDEDIGLLLRGLTAWDRESSTNLTIVITGKGPMRERFEREIARASFRRTQVRTLFLSPADYRNLLRAADFGISMHRSSSGVDLPMKIVDCFGAGLPVLAYNYGPCLEEQVLPGRTGLLFRDERELAETLAEILDTERRSYLSEGVARHASDSWADEWNCQVRPVLHPLRRAPTPIRPAGLNRENPND